MTPEEVLKEVTPRKMQNAGVNGILAWKLHQVAVDVPEDYRKDVKLFEEVWMCLATGSLVLALPPKDKTNDKQTSPRRKRSRKISGI